MSIFHAVVVLFLTNSEIFEYCMWLSYADDLYFDELEPVYEA